MAQTAEEFVSHVVGMLAMPLNITGHVYLFLSIFVFVFVFVYHMVGMLATPLNITGLVYLFLSIFNDNTCSGKIRCAKLAF